MIRNKICFCELMDIVSRHLEDEESFVVVCDAELKEELAEHLYENYGLVDTKEETDCNEYYISVAWFGNECDFSIESAKCRNDTYKMHNIGECDYFIFTDIDSQVARERLIGDKMFCELIDCDEYEYCNCEDDEDMDVEVKFIMDKAEELLNRDFCPDCAIQFVADIFTIGKAIGFDECRLKMENFIGNFDGGLLP